MNQSPAKTGFQAAWGVVWGIITALVVISLIAMFLAHHFGPTPTRQYQQCVAAAEAQGLIPGAYCTPPGP